MNLDPIKAREEYYRWLRMGGDDITWIEENTSDTDVCYESKIVHEDAKLFIENRMPMRDIFWYLTVRESFGNEIKTTHTEKSYDRDYMFYMARYFYRKWKYKQLTGDDLDE